jgi:uncharacterized protein YabE (DUF348 family)
MKNLFGTTANNAQANLSPGTTETEVNDAENPALDEKPRQDAQVGVQKAEAVTLLWTKNQLIVAYILSVS